MRRELYSVACLLFPLGKGKQEGKDSLADMKEENTVG